MGQRLVVDLIKDDKIVAAVYYHWSAYFGSTVDELASLSRAILEANRTGKDKLFAVIQLLETNKFSTDCRGNLIIRSGGIEGIPEEQQAARKMFPNFIPKTNVNRTCGLVALTEKGIESFHDWEEGHAEINLDTLEVSHDVTLDPHPFEFDAETIVDEDGYFKEYVFHSGKIKINGKTLPINAFEGTCESFIKLDEMMKEEANKIRPTAPW